MARNATGDLSNSTETALSSIPCPRMRGRAWQHEYLTPTTSKVFLALISLEVPIALFTFLLNAMVIWAVWRKRYLRKQKSFALLACLAATDLLVGAVVLPLVIASHAVRLSSKPVCLVDTLAIACIFIACVVSLLHLVIISGERYVAIKHALRYETLVTTRRLTAAVGAAWAFAVFVTSAVVSTTALKGPVFIFVMFIFLPGSVALITFYQIAVFLESRRHREHILAHQTSEAAAKEILKKDKAARTTAMIVGALLLCYASAPVYRVVGFVISDRVPKSLLVSSAFVEDLLLLCNSLINPVIYCLRTQDFRTALKELFNLASTTPRRETVRARNLTQRQENCSPRQRSWHGEMSRIRSLDLSPHPSRRQGIRRNNSI